MRITDPVLVPDVNITKKCCKCQVEKPLSEYGKQKPHLDGLRSRCKTCTNEDGKIYYASHQEQHYAKGKEWAVNHREKRREYVRKSYFAHQDQRQAYGRKYHEEHKEVRALSNSLWYKNNKEKASVLNRKKRATRMSASGKGITEKQAITLKEETGFRCVYCGKKSEKLQIDHVVPLSRGGTDDIENAVPACKICNVKKGNKSLLFFLLATKNDYVNIGETA